MVELIDRILDEPRRALRLALIMAVFLTVVALALALSRGHTPVILGAVSGGSNRKRLAVPGDRATEHRTRGKGRGCLPVHCERPK